MKPKSVLFYAAAFLVFVAGCASPPMQSRGFDGRSTLPVATRGVIESVIVSDFEGFNYGNIYELANGQFWEQVEAWIWTWIAIQPKAVIVSSGGVSRMRVEQIEHAILVRQIEPVVESRVVSDFSGFDQGNLYELLNGQVWQQTESKIRMRIRVSPRVIIWKSGETYRMRIGDIPDTVLVRKVK